MFKHRQAKCHVELSKPSVCVDLNSYTPKTPPHNAKRWLNNDLFQLDQSEKAILLTPTAWLTDSIIDASQKLLLQKMPSNTGFQSVTLGRTLHFELQSNEFVQILHNGHGHWLTISTVGMTHPENLCVLQYVPDHVNTRKTSDRKAACNYSKQNPTETHGPANAKWGL